MRAYDGYDQLEITLSDFDASLRIRALQLDSLIRKAGLHLIRTSATRIDYGLVDSVVHVIVNNSSLQLNRTLKRRSKKFEKDSIRIESHLPMPIDSIRDHIAHSKSKFYETTRRRTEKLLKTLKFPLNVPITSPLQTKPVSDEEYLQAKGIKHILAEVLKGFIIYAPRSVNSDVDRAIATALKLADIRNVQLFQAAIESLEDTQHAIDDVCLRGLHTRPSISSNHGECYLRLYGVLNAVNQQVQCIETILCIFCNSNSKVYKKQLNALQVMKLRHLVASHAMNNMVTGPKDVSFQRLTAITVNKWGHRLAVVSEKEGYLEFNLMDLLEEYDRVSSMILLDLAQKVMETRFQQKNDGREWMRIMVKCVKERLSKDE